MPTTPTMVAPDFLAFDGDGDEPPSRLEVVTGADGPPADVAEDLGWLLRTLGATGPRCRPHLVLHGHSSLRMLVPAEPAALAAAFNRPCDAQTTTYRLLSAVARNLGRRGQGRLMPGARVLLPPFTLVDQLARQLGEPGLSATVLLGPRRPTRKPVLQLTRPDGSVVGYAKVGWSPATTALVDNEALALTLAGGRLGPRAEAPELVWAGRWRDRGVVVSSPLGRGRFRLPLRWPGARPGARSRTTVRPEARPWVPRPPGRPGSQGGPVDHLPTDPATAELVLSIAAQVPAPPRPVVDLHLWGQWEEAGLGRFVDLGEVRRRHGERVLPLGFWHGDLGPWNLRTTPRGTLVWDWERAGVERPIGFDALNLALERLRLDPWLAHRAGLQTVVARCADVLDPLGLDLAPADRQALVDLYLCELAGRSLRTPGEAWLSPLDGPGSAALDLLVHRLG